MINELWTLFADGKPNGFVAYNLPPDEYERLSIEMMNARKGEEPADALIVRDVPILCVDKPIGWVTFEQAAEAKSLLPLNRLS